MKTAESKISKPAVQRKANKPFFGKGKDGFFEKPVQAKLTVGKTNDVYEKEADAMADKVVQKKSVNPDVTPITHATTPVQPKFDNCEKEEKQNEKKEDSEDEQLQRKPIFESNAEPPGDDDNTIQRSSVREWEEGDKVVQLSETDQTPKSDGSRESIVAAAKAELGKVEAKLNDGTGSRVGADRLLEYFHIAAPGVWEDSIISTAGAKMPSWCGIFSVYAHKKAGKDVGEWQIGKGVSAFNTLTTTDSPQPGDIGYIDQPYQHHNIVKEVAGDTITTIDGNSGINSEVKENTKPRSDYSGFMTAFGGAASGNVQSKGEPTASANTAPSKVESGINSTKGKGNSLPDATRNEMEQSFGTDFSDVRVHTGSTASSLSHDLKAQAFTHGSDIYFNTGKYDTSSTAGKHLLAHELTHTIQQGSRNSVNKKPDIQRLPDPPKESIADKIKKVTSPMKNGDNLLMNGELIQVHLFDFAVKSYVENPPTKVTKPKGEKRLKTYADIWSKLVKTDIATAFSTVTGTVAAADLLRLNTKDTAKDQGKSPTGKQTGMIGNSKELQDEIQVPFWDKDGKGIIHRIEHALDIQLIGNTLANVATNLVLIDDESNAKLNYAVDKLMKDRVLDVLKHYKIENDVTPTKVLEKDTVIFETFKPEKATKIKSLIRPADFKKDEKENPVSKERITVQPFEIPDGHLLLKTADKGVSYLLPYKFKSKIIEFEGDAKEGKLEKAVFLKPWVDEKGQLTDPKPIDLGVTPIEGKKHQFKLQSAFGGASRLIPEGLKFAHLSPIEIDQSSVMLDPHAGVTLNGKIKPSIKPLEGVDIDFMVEKGVFTLRASVTFDKIKVPDPFKVDYCTLFIEANSKKEFAAGGEIGFGIKKIGEGRIAVKGGSTGFFFDGEFALDKNIFDGKIQVDYAKKKGEEDGSWTIRGTVKVGKNKITGLDSLTLEFARSEEELSGKGTAMLSVPGIKQVDIKAIAKKDGQMSIEGTVEIKDIPKLDGATATVKIERKTEGAPWDISVAGRVKPKVSIGGLELKEVDIKYAKGIFNIKASAHYEKGRLKGDFEVGVTNKAVTNGKKPEGIDAEEVAGEGGKEMSFWAHGKITVNVTKDIGSEIDVYIKPDGDLQLDGKIELLNDKPLFSLKPYTKNLITLDKNIILASCGILSLKLHLGGAVDIYADLKPLTFDKGSHIKLNNVSLRDMSNVNITSEINISSHFDAGITLALEVGLDVSLLGILNAGVGGGGKLDFKAINADAKASFGAKWSPEKGITLTKSQLDVSLKSQLTMKLTAYARVYADLLVTTITIWRHDWTLAEKTIDINLFGKGKINIPLPIGDDGGVDMTGDKLKGNLGAVSDAGTQENMAKRSQAVLDGDGKTEEDRQAEANETVKTEVLARFRDKERFNFRKCDNYLFDRYTLVNHLRNKAKFTKEIDLSYIEEEIKKAEREEFDAFGPFIEKEDMDADNKHLLIDDFIVNHPTLGETERANLKSLVPAKTVQKKSQAGSPASTNTTAVSNHIDASKGKGEALPGNVQKDMESSFGQNFDDVRVHNDQGSADMNKELNAKAFTTGNDIYFNNGQYNTNSTSGKHLLAHELTHVVQQGNGNGHDIQRREFGPLEDEALIIEGDWAYADRLSKLTRWDQANEYNIVNARSRQYTQIDQRRDFYLWFYNKMRGRGHEVKWPLAAYVVAGGANEVANRDPGRMNALRSNNLEQLMRRGNQIIFDDVFPKLRELYMRKAPVVGDEAQQWDMKTLGEEQNLIQPLYKDLSPDELQTMEDLAKQKGFFVTVGSSLFGDIDGGPYHTGGGVPALPAGYDISLPADRYRYGMALAHYFTNGATDFEASKVWAESLQVPEVTEEYKNGEALKKYDSYNNLHHLSSIVSDVASTPDQIKNAVWQLTDAERDIAMVDPWFSATLRHIHYMSAIEADSVLRSQDTSKCGPLFQVIGFIEGTGMANEDDEIIVSLSTSGVFTNWTTRSGQQRLQVQAHSDSAYKMFTGVHKRFVWQSSLHCYPKKKPLPPPPPPIEKVYSVYFDTQSDVIMEDSHEWNNRWELNNVLSDLRDYGADPKVSDLQLYITGHASPVWKTAKTALAAATENEQLAMRRAKNVRSYIMDVYQQHKGPVSLMTLNPLTDAVMVPIPANTTPAKVVSDEGQGSDQGLGETADPKNNDQRYRRVDISIRAVFDNVKTP